MDVSTSQSKKIEIRFEIATTLVLSLPTLFCIVEIICKGIAYRDVLNPCLLFIFPSICIFLTGIAFLPKYKNLFNEPNGTKAFFIQATPFIPTFIIGILATIKAIQGDWTIINGYVAGFITTPCSLALTTKAIILFSIRKRLKNK